MTQANDQTGPDEPNPVRSRSRWLWVWATTSALAIVAAFVLGTQVRSPWQSAIANAQAQPLVTARVEQRALPTAQVPVTAKVSLGPEQAVNPRGGADAQAVVTAVRATAGDVLAPGDVLVEVSGRPVIALALPFPLYRDILPGSTGPDVQAVQQAMADLNLYTGALDGQYGSSTAQAVDRLYERAGVEAPSPSADAEGAVKAAEDALAEAQRAKRVQDAAAAAGDAETPAPPADTTEVEAARRTLVAARFAAMTPLPMGEVVSVAAQGATVIRVASVGTVVGGEGQSGVASLRSGSPTATARVGLDQIDAVPVGATVTVTGALDAASSTTGTVTEIGEFDASATDSGAPPGRDITVVLDPDMTLGDGAEVLIIPTGTQATIEGLTVPLVAVREDSAGTFVLHLPDGKARNEESTERVAVTVEATGDGYAIIGPGALDEGDLVVVARP